MIQQYLTFKQLLVAFQVNKHTANNWVKRGVPRYCINPGSINSEWRYDVAEVASWLRGQNPCEKGDSNEN